jgi:hypothetical protein
MHRTGLLSACFQLSIVNFGSVWFVRFTEVRNRKYLGEFDSQESGLEQQPKFSVLVFSVRFRFIWFGFQFFWFGSAFRFFVPRLNNNLHDRVKVPNG